jgi:hypothetical protein
VAEPQQKHGHKPARREAQKYVESAPTGLRILAGQAISTATALVQSAFNSSASGAAVGSFSPFSSSSSPSSSPSLDPASTVPLRSPRASAPPLQRWPPLSLPGGRRFLGYLWYGSLYVTAGFASHGSAREPSGLYGPLGSRATSRHGTATFTLDYNQESQLFHVRTQERPPRARPPLYFGSISAWVDSCAREPSRRT